MNVLVIGTGSIGSRHLANLVELGHTVCAVDKNPKQLAEVAGLSAKSFTSLPEALAIRPDAVFICTFSNDHISPATECAKAGCHLFIEKPLSLSLEGIDELIDTIDGRNLISMVGCNMRFHPAIVSVHDILAGDPRFARKLWANLEFGYYLPFAKPDYESGYQANRQMGGNLIFDRIHELDYAIWFFGEPAEVLCTKSVISSLKMDTEDHVEMIVGFHSGVVCTIHLDYLQHGYCFRCKVVCEAGTAVWDFTEGKLGTISTDAPQWSWKDMKLDIYYKQMYVDEVKHFLDCVEHGSETTNSVAASLPVLKLAIAADKSCQTRAWEPV